MRTVAELETRIQRKFNDTSTKVQNLLRELVDTEIRRVKRELKAPFEYGSATITSVASQQNYDLPVDTRMVIDVKVTTGGNDYYPIPIASRDQWNQLNAVTSTPTSDIPDFFYIDPEGSGYEVLLYPTPASAGNTITVTYYVLPKDLDSADFTDKTAGTVSITNGATTVTGVGTSFAATDVGRRIRFDTDGYWYKIATFTNSTTIDIDRNYEGTTISGGAYKIGTAPAIPEDALQVVEYFVLQGLWEKREDFSIAGGKASYYEDRAKRLLKKLKQDLDELFDSPTVAVVPRSFVILNPNDFPTNLS